MAQTEEFFWVFTTTEVVRRPVLAFKRQFPGRPLLPTVCTNGVAFQVLIMCKVCRMEVRWVERTTGTGVLVQPAGFSQRRSDRVIWL